MSKATVRAKRPFAATRSSQSRELSGLPCTKTTALLARSGPACWTRVLTPPTDTRVVRTPAGSGGVPTSMLCSASVAMPSGPPSGVQYWDAGSSARAVDAPSRARATATTGKTLRTNRTVAPPGFATRRSTPGYGRQDRDLVAVLDGRLEAVEEADVLAAHVDVHEAPQVPVDSDPITQAVVAVVEA